MGRKEAALQTRGRGPNNRPGTVCCNFHDQRVDPTEGQGPIPEVGESHGDRFPLKRTCSVEDRRSGKRKIRMSRNSKWNEGSKKVPEGRFEISDRIPEGRIFHKEPKIIAFLFKL